jgi:hypothetical protein
MLGCNYREMYSDLFASCFRWLFCVGSSGYDQERTANREIHQHQAHYPLIEYVYHICVPLSSRKDGTPATYLSLYEHFLS